ncbi:MAG: catechol 2,3-dioxygenase [Ktedonobacteraceae bacterium]
MEKTHQEILHPATHVGLVTLAVSSLERSIDYYQNGLGFTVKERNERIALLGSATDSPLLALIEQPNARPQPANTTGLYHFAILLPSRKDLGRTLSHIVESQTPLGGHSDHLVSEALYLSDPDGNGIEIYRDRPRSTWSWHDGLVAMTLDPIDLEGLMEEGRQDMAEWAGLPPQTTLGHMHLRVGNIQQAEQFYHQVLGFAVTQYMPGALFVSAGGYHHHIGLNTWQSRNGPQPPADSVGARFFTIQLPDEAELAKVLARLQVAGWPVEQREGGVSLRDPSGNKLLLTTHELTSIEAIQNIMK